MIWHIEGHVKRLIYLKYVFPKIDIRYEILDMRCERIEPCDKSECLKSNISYLTSKIKIHV